MVVGVGQDFHIPSGAQSDVFAVASGGPASWDSFKPGATPVFMMALRTDQSVALWGDASFFPTVLGKAPCGITHPRPSTCPAKQNVVAVRASSLTAAALLANGQVLVWGERTNWTANVTDFPGAPEPVEDLALGTGHGVALLRSGRVVSALTLTRHSHCETMERNR